MRQQLHISLHRPQGDSHALASNVLADDSAQVVALLERLRVIAFPANALTRVCTRRLPIWREHEAKQCYLAPSHPKHHMVVHHGFVTVLHPSQDRWVDAWGRHLQCVCASSPASVHPLTLLAHHLQFWTTAGWSCSATWPWRTCCYTTKRGVLLCHHDERGTNAQTDSARAGRIFLHCKTDPVFVSDVTVPDVELHFEV